MITPARHLHRTVPLTALQVFWSVSALVGLFGVGWASSGVTGLADFWRDVLGSSGALTVSMDLVLLAVPVLAFAVIESRRLGMRMPWIWVPLAVPLPGAFVIPLFFLMRERALIRQRPA
jgi:Terpene cyclase DEP1